MQRNAPALRGTGFGLLPGNGVIVQKHVSVGL